MEHQVIMPIQPELGCMNSVPSYYQGDAAPIRSSGGRVVRITENKRAKEGPHVHFKPGHVIDDSHEIVYPAECNSMDMIRDDQEIHNDSDDVVEYEFSEGDANETSYHAMTLDSMDKPFIAPIDDSDCYLLSYFDFKSCDKRRHQASGVSYQLMRMEVSIQGDDGVALIDSGAGHRFVRIGWLRARGLADRIKPTSRSIKQANGTFESVGSISLHLAVGDVSDDAAYIVVPDGGEHDIVLGMSWLTKYNPSIDWAKCAMSFDTTAVEGRSISINIQHVSEVDEVESVRVSATEFRRKSQPNLSMFCIELTQTLEEEAKASLNQHEVIADVEASVQPHDVVVSRYEDHIVDEIPGGASKDNQLPRHRIEWKGVKPPCRPLIRLSYKELDHLKQKLDGFLEKK